MLCLRMIKVLIAYSTIDSCDSQEHECMLQDTKLYSVAVYFVELLSSSMSSGKEKKKGDRRTGFGLRSVRVIIIYILKK